MSQSSPPPPPPRQWHTLPPNDALPDAKSAAPPRPLSALVAAAGWPQHAPLHGFVKMADTFTAALTDAERAWLAASVAPAFDSYVTRVLSANRFKPWKRDADLRAEVALSTTTTTPHEAYSLPLYTLMGRVLSYGELESEVRAASTSADGSVCLWDAFHMKDHHERPKHERAYVSAPHGADTMRVWYIEPSTMRGSPFNPRERWGVMAIDWEGGSSYTQLSSTYLSAQSMPIRMACCGQYLGATPGCWIALPGDASAAHGEVRAYSVFGSAVNWSTLAQDAAAPDAAAWAVDVVRGTAFQDVPYYAALDSQIRGLIVAIAPRMPSALKAYTDKLQEPIDKAISASDPYQLDLDAYATLVAAVPELDTLVALLNKFNAVQMRDPVALSARDFVNERIVHAHKIHEHWTFDARSGLKLSQPGIRLNRLNNTRPAKVAELDAFVATIQAEPTVILGLGEMSALATTLRPAAEQLEAAAGDYVLAEKLQLAIAKNGLQAQFPQVQAWLDERDATSSQMVARQRRVNDIMRAMREPGGIKAGSPVLLSLPANVVRPATPPSNLDAIRVAVAAAIIAKKAPREAVPVTPAAGAETAAIYAALMAALTRVPVLRIEPPVVRSDARVIAIVNAYEAEMRGTVREDTEELAEQTRQLQGQMAYVRQKAGKNANIAAAAATNLKLADQLNALDALVQQHLAARVLKSDNAQKAIDGVVRVLQQRDAQIAAALVIPPSSIAPLQAADTPATLAAQIAGMLALVEPFGQLLLTAGATASMRASIGEARAAVPEPELLAVAAERAKYVAAWDGSVVAAAKRLKAALDALAAMLRVAAPATLLTGSPAIANLITAAVLEADALAVAAVAGRDALEDPAERKRKQQQERVRRERLIGADFNAWLSAPNMRALVVGSERGLAALRPLWQDGRVQADVSAADRRAFAAGALILGDVLPARIFTAHELGGAVRVSALATIVPGSAYFGMTKDEAVISTTWAAFRDHLVTLGSAGGDSSAFVAPPSIAQPDRIERLLSPSPVSPDVGNHWTYDDYGKRGISSMVAPHSALNWIDNSCWIDATFMALFAWPQTTLSDRIRSAQTINVWQDALHFSSGVASVPISCTDQSEREDLHRAILEDVEYIQNPAPTGAGTRVCRTKALWMQRCVKQPLTGKLQYGDAAVVFEAISEFYGGLSIGHLAAMPTAQNPAYHVQLLEYDIPSLAQQIDGNGAIRAGRVANLVTTTSASHKVAAIVYSIGFFDSTSRTLDFGHYIAHLRRSFRDDDDTWLIFDKSGNYKRYEALKSTEILQQWDDIAVYSYKDNSGQAQTRYRVPAAVVWISNDEVARLVALRNVADGYMAALPPPPPVPSQPAPTITLQTDAQVRALAVGLHTRGGSAGKRLAQALGLRPDTTRWERDKDALRGTLYVGHLGDRDGRLEALSRAYDAAAQWLDTVVSSERANAETDIAIYATRAALGAHRYPATAKLTQAIHERMLSWPRGPLVYAPEDDEERKLFFALMTKGGPVDPDDDEWTVAVATRLRLSQYIK